MLMFRLPSQSITLSWRVVPRIELITPSLSYIWVQMKPTTASDRTTGMKNALW